MEDICTLMYMVKRATATGLRKHLFAALDDVENGDTVIVTRRGKPVATLTGAQAADLRPEPDQAALRTFCQKHRIRELSLFGSILRSDFGPSSDVDVLFDPERGKTYPHLEYLDMEDELGAIFGRRVDLVNRRVLLQHENEIRRHEILSTAKAIVTMKANAA